MGGRARSLIDTVLPHPLAVIDQMADLMAISITPMPDLYNNPLEIPKQAQVAEICEGSADQ